MQLIIDTASLQPASSVNFGIGPHGGSSAGSKKCGDCGDIVNEASLLCRSCLIEARDAAERARQAAREGCKPS